MEPLCTSCCMDDQPPSTSDSPSQSHDMNMEEQEFETYEEWCTSMAETEEYELALEQTLNDAIEGAEKEYQEMEKIGGRTFKRYLRGLVLLEGAASESESGEEEEEEEENTADEEEWDNDDED